MRLRTILWTIGFIAILANLAPANAQFLGKRSFVLGPVEPEKGLASNSVTDIDLLNTSLWLGTGRGLSRTNNDGLDFDSFGPDQGIGRGGVSALAVRDDIIWVATGFDSTTDLGTLQTGGGLAFSQNSGSDWTFIPQPGSTPITNITFDIALRNDEVWITSFGGGLRKSTDLGSNWDIVTPDSFLFDPNAHLNHRAFSVINVDGILWVGTAGGVNRSTDGGQTWTNFSHSATDSATITGNFVVALANQRWNGADILWAGTRPTTVESGDETEFLGVSLSRDQGFTWQTTLHGETVHNFAFDDSVVYAASSNGLYKSNDFGEHWFLFPPMENETGTRRILNRKVFDAEVTAGHTVWTGTGNGLAKTSDNGANWQIFQVFPPTGRDGEPRTYAYPNPFSPNVHNRLNGEGNVRFQYNTTRDTRVTLKLYNFAMEHVVTVVENAPRAGNGDFYETWNGRTRDGRQVGNGVYFYRLDLEGEGAFWGKLIVLK